MTDIILIIFWGVVLLSIIVVIHEAGHYFAARAFKIRVLEFMVGLPGPNKGYRPKNSRTKFGITAIPLGGYARIAGMEQDVKDEYLEKAAAYLYKHGMLDAEAIEKSSEVFGFDMKEALDCLCEWGSAQKISSKHTGDTYFTPEFGEYKLGDVRPLDNPNKFIEEEKSQTYISLPWRKRLAILFAGPVANLLTAIIVVTLTLCLVGTSAASLTISSVTEDSPAATAGLQAGDTITSIDGQQVSSWSEFLTLMSDVEVGQEVQLTYERDGQSYSATMTTQSAQDEDRAIIGVVAGIENQRYTLAEGFNQSLSYIGQTTEAIISLFNPAQSAEVISQSTSVVGISVVAKEAASAGFVSFIWLVAVLSISIGLMNLLPLMPLDGGRIVVETIQKIARRKLPMSFINGYSMVGLFLTMLLFIVVIGQDIGNLISGTFPI